MYVHSVLIVILYICIINSMFVLHVRAKKLVIGASLSELCRSLSGSRGAMWIIMYIAGVLCVLCVFSICVYTCTLTAVS